MPSERQPLLFLCHRIPFPPNKGDKIRSYHWLAHLSRHFDVHLGAFVDDDDDWRHEQTVADMCASCKLVPLRGTARALRAARGMVTGDPLTIAIYQDAQMREWVESRLALPGMGRVLVFSSAMATYLPPPEQHPDLEVLVDFVDVDSDKWRQYAESKRWPVSMVYQREARRLLDFERTIAKQASMSFFVSEPEAKLFVDLAGTGDARVESLTNGVDYDFFDPGLELANPYPDGCRPIVFTGAMDYWANVDAVSWFVLEALDAVRRRVPDQRLYIVGSRPTPAVHQLASDCVAVTGSVEDIRPYIRHAGVIVAPMRIARGIQNKVLEAMSMAKAVVVSPQGLDGIEVEVEQEVILATTAEEFADRVVDVLNGEYEGMGSRARAAVTSRYSWQASFSRLDELMGVVT